MYEYGFPYVVHVNAYWRYRLQRWEHVSEHWRSLPTR